eukprot:g1826.t1
MIMWPQCRLGLLKSTKRWHFGHKIRRFSQGAQAPLSRKVTVTEVTRMYKKKKKISMVTAYDYPSAVHVDRADIDILLVGDSVAMVSLGHKNTLPVTVDEMIYHCRAVSRGNSRCLLVGDMPFGSYEEGPAKALETAQRFLKEGNADVVKLEGGAARASSIKHIVESGGIAVMGHIGLTPQSISVLGGFRSQGRSVDATKKLLNDALALQDAGCFALVIECVPADVGKLITQHLDIPTIGIGAGGHTSGQVLVYHDLLGIMEHPHFKAMTPGFCKTYGHIGSDIHRALVNYREDVESGIFPGEQFSPYRMSAKQTVVVEKLLQEVEQQRGLLRSESGKKDVDIEMTMDNEGPIYGGGGGSTT